ncbi:polysaccharide pyruvyl transferase family protein [Thermococcus sp. 18S1]|uniref:polysaccharide pyruvyl transferase family protein n=1 Tax=Thermococcus sp. 18S1 TaxID=1638210 RepID=UPI00143A5DF9|nr:polysaccharide pyruvyl transferase family protein [Thermococcus sp. 18S1]NJE30326.1 polysaccharide pyruvyl transferase family protein [Thermococcus sp. 18S1]
MEKLNNNIPYIINFAPHAGTMNLGDYIIWDSIKSILTDLLKHENVMVLNFSSHQPLSWYHKMLLKRLKKEKIPYIILLSGANPFHPYYSPVSSLNQWAVGITDIQNLKNKVLLFGTGTIIAPPSIKRHILSLYALKFWKLVMTKEFVHEVRDDESIELAHKIGIYNVVNLGCPTLWKLTKKFVGKIPTTKSNSVVTTITANKKDPERDKLMLKILLKNYEEVYLWPQGTEDIIYINKTIVPLCPECVKIKILPPTLWAYDQLLSKTNIDYIGTRVHGGIRALQHKRRSIIVSVDHRASSFSKSFGIYSINRDEIAGLDDVINSKIKVRIQIPEKRIKKYLEEFKRYVNSL